MNKKKSLKILLELHNTTEKIDTLLRVNIEDKSLAALKRRLIVLVERSARLLIKLELALVDE